MASACGQQVQPNAGEQGLSTDLESSRRVLMRAKPKSVDDCVKTMRRKGVTLFAKSWPDHDACICCRLACAAQMLCIAQGEADRNPSLLCLGPQLGIILLLGMPQHMLALVCESEAADGIGVIVGNIAACPRRDLEDIALQEHGAFIDAVQTIAAWWSSSQE